MDIDIDTQVFFKPEEVFSDIVKASMVENRKLRKHPCGVYFQDIPKDNITQLSAIPYKEAETLGYTKIDFLHLTLLDGFSSKEHLRTVLNRPVNWKLFENKEIVKTLFHIGNHFDFVKRVKPTSIDDLADVLALIRPGKKHLIERYLQDKENVRKELYQKNNNEYVFKRSHSIAYAMNIILQVNSDKYIDTVEKLVCK